MYRKNLVYIAFSTFHGFRLPQGLGADVLWVGGAPVIAQCSAIMQQNLGH